MLILAPFGLDCQPFLAGRPLPGLAGCGTAFARASEVSLTGVWLATVTASTPPMARRHPPGAENAFDVRLWMRAGPSALPCYQGPCTLQRFDLSASSVSIRACAA